MVEYQVPFVLVRIALIAVLIPFVASHAEAQGDTDLETLDGTVRALADQVDELEDRIDILEEVRGRSGAGQGIGTCDDCTEYMLSPDESGDGAAPGVVGREIMSFLRELPPEFWDIPGTSLHFGAGQLRLAVPHSAQGLDLLESPSFIRELRGGDQLSGFMRLDNVTPEQIERLYQSDSRFEFRAVPGTDRVDLHFNGRAPSALLDIIRNAAPEEREPVRAP